MAICWSAYPIVGSFFATVNQLCPRVLRRLTLRARVVEPRRCSRENSGEEGCTGFYVAGYCWHFEVGRDP